MSKATNNANKSSNSEVEKVNCTRPGDSVVASAMAGGAPSTPKLTGTSKDVSKVVPRKVEVIKNKVRNHQIFYILKGKKEKKESKKEYNMKKRFNQKKNLRQSCSKKDIKNQVRNEREEGKRGGILSNKINHKHTEKFRNQLLEKYSLKKAKGKVAGSLSKTLNCMQPEDKIRTNIIFRVRNTHGCMKTKKIMICKKDTLIESETIKYLKAEIIKSSSINILILQEMIREVKEGGKTSRKDSEKQKGKLITIDDEQVKTCIKIRNIFIGKHRVLKGFSSEVSNVHGYVKTKVQNLETKKDLKKETSKDIIKETQKEKCKIIKSLTITYIREKVIYLCSFIVKLQDTLERIMSQEQKLEETGEISDDLLDFSETDDPNATVVSHDEVDDLLVDNDDKIELTQIPGKEGEIMKFRSQHQAAIRNLKERSRARAKSESDRKRSDSVSSFTSIKRKFDETNDNTNRTDKDASFKKVTNKKTADKTQPPPNKRPTFSDKVKGKINVEIRTNPAGIELDKPDFEHVAIKIMDELIDMKKTDPEKVEWKVERGGASQGAIYYIVETQKTADFIKIAAPKIVPLAKGKDEQPTYKYVVYGPNEHPYRYLRWRIPSFWKSTPVEKLTEILLAVNDEVDIDVPIPSGGSRKAVIRVKKILDDKPGQPPAKSKPKKNSSSTVLMLLEVEECLIDILINQKQGMLALGPHNCRIEGGAGNGGPGIQERVRLAAEAAEAAKAANGNEEMEEVSNEATQD